MLKKLVGKKLKVGSWIYCADGERIGILCGRKTDGDILCGWRTDWNIVRIENGLEYRED